MNCTECIEHKDIKMTINSEGIEVPDCFLEYYDEKKDTNYCGNFHQEEKK